MVNEEEDYEDLDEYEAMEAEAEELAKQPAPMQKTQQLQRTQPQMQRGVQPQKVERRGRPPKVQQMQQQMVRTPVQVQSVQPQEDTLTEEVAEEKTEKAPKWVPYHQPEEIGLVNTETGERIKSFKEEGNAIAIAKVLNELDLIVTGGGYQ